MLRCKISNFRCMIFKTVVFVISQPISLVFAAMESCRSAYYEISVVLNRTLVVGALTPHGARQRHISHFSTNFFSFSCNRKLSKYI